MLAFST